MASLTAPSTNTSTGLYSQSHYAPSLDNLLESEVIVGDESDSDPDQHVYQSNGHHNNPSEPTSLALSESNASYTSATPTSRRSTPTPSPRVTISPAPTPRTPLHHRGVRSSQPAGGGEGSITSPRRTPMSPRRFSQPPAPLQAPFVVLPLRSPSWSQPTASSAMKQGSKVKDTKYATLGRRSKISIPETEDANAKLAASAGVGTVEAKNVMDKFATLPRKRVKERPALPQFVIEKEKDKDNKESMKKDFHYATLPRRPKEKAPSSSSSSSSDGVRAKPAAPTEHKTTPKVVAPIGSPLLKPKVPEKPKDLIRSVATPSPKRTVSSVTAATKTTKSTPPPPPPKPRSVLTGTLGAVSRKTMIFLEKCSQTVLTLTDIEDAMEVVKKQGRMSASMSRDVSQQFESQGVQTEALTDAMGLTNTAQREKALAACQDEIKEYEALYKATLEAIQTKSMALEEAEQEVSRYQALLEEERMERRLVQDELDKTSLRVSAMIDSMEGVEREFTNRGNSLLEIESKLQVSTHAVYSLQDEVGTLQDALRSQAFELDRSMAAQKTLLQQLQDTEAESRELQEFLQAEKSTLTEALREAESEINSLKGTVVEKEKALKRQEEECQHLVRLAEQRKHELLALQHELQGAQGRAGSALVSQGAQISAASVFVADLAVRIDSAIQNLVNKHQLTSDDLEASVYLNEAYHEPEFSRASPSVSSSLPVDDVTAHARPPLIGSPSLQNLSNAINLRNPPEGEERQENNVSEESPHSLTDQLDEVDHLLTRLLKAVDRVGQQQEHVIVQLRDQIIQWEASYKAQSITLAETREELTHSQNAENRVMTELQRLQVQLSQSQKETERALSLPSGVENNEVVSLRAALLDKERFVTEMQAKLARQKRALTENWHRSQQDADARREALARVQQVLNALPDSVLAANPELSALPAYLCRYVSSNRDMDFPSNDLNANGSLS